MDNLSNAVAIHRERVAVKVFFENGNSLITEINGNFERAKDYYLNKVFNIGQCGHDNMSKCISVKLL